MTIENVLIPMVYFKGTGMNKEVMTSYGKAEQ